ncbi:AI-2E family transporter [Planctomycetaceae bacterium SH139]
MDGISRTRSALIALWISTGLLLIFAGYYARSLITPFVVAFLLYLTLRPVVSQLSRHRVPPPISATVLLVIFLVILAIGVVTVIEPASSWTQNLPSQVARLRDKLSTMDGPFDELRRARKEVEAIGQAGGGGDAALDDPIAVEVIQPAWTSRYLVNSTSSAISFLVVVVVLAFFLLATGDSLINRVLHVMPNFGQRRNTVELIVDLQSAVSRYLAQVTIINIGLGVAVAIVMYFLGMPTPLLWGTMATLLNYIPFLGALLGAAVIFLAAVVAFEPLSWAFLTTAAYLTLTTTEGQLITPTLIGRKLQLSPFFVIVSVVFWGWMWGIVGVFVSVPLLIVIRMACEHTAIAAPLAFILGGDVSLLPFDDDVRPEQGDGELGRI